MSYLTRFIKALFSRQALVLLAVVAIWFVGPLIAIGGFHPLETVITRVLSIVLLLALLLFWMRDWPLMTLCIIWLCIGLWYLGPMVALGNARPLAAPWLRALLIVLLLGCYAVHCLYRLWSRIRSDSALMQRIVNPFVGEADNDSSPHISGHPVDRVVKSAIEKLKRMRIRRSGLRRLWESNRYVYELPWYMVIGSPAAGKTTLILNSGLDFPDAELMSIPSLATCGETQNCDWLFANEAVLIDTAGRYTFQEVVSQGDSGMKVDNATEWRGFLGLLSKSRPLAPINGVLLTVSAEELLTYSASDRKAMAASIRTRLGELRQELRIWFPVYVLVTKLDLLQGFNEYFHSLTDESRAQVLGFTLPYRQEKAEYRREALREHCAIEMRELVQTLEGGINLRLQEEYELDKRRTLYALPSEFRSLCAQATELIAQVFLDSAYEDTQLNRALRGVYFSSATQTHQTVPADSTTLLQRLRRGLAGVSSADRSANALPPIRGGDVAHRSYFLRNLFQQVILSEKNLVRPSRRWETHFRALQLFGHLLSITVAVWLIGALIISFGNNREYLSAVQGKTDELATRLRAGDEAQKIEDMGLRLSESRDLPQFRGLDLDNPGAAWHYGLYAAPPVVDASHTAYRNLLSQTILPRVVSRLEQALDSQILEQNLDEVYHALSVYLMLYDREHYDPKAIKAWVQSDWERTDSITSADVRELMMKHIDALFSDGEPVEPARAQDTVLVKRARDFLERDPVSMRLYRQAMVRMGEEVPENVTLTRAAGQHAMAVFTLTDRAMRENGIPGIYTYDGYHKILEKRLPEFVRNVRTQDAWIMGLRLPRSAQGGTESDESVGADNDRLANEIRRQYLTDYGNYWQQFLGDIRPVSGSHGPLSLDLQALRVLAEPDSPLVQLARTATRETSLATTQDSSNTSIAETTTNALVRRLGVTQETSDVMGAMETARKFAHREMEKDLVDSRFAALREVVTGYADTQGNTGATRALTAGSALRLDGIMGLIQEQYAHLVMTSNMLATSGMPSSSDLGPTLQLEAEKLPAPFRAVLAGMTAQSMQKVSRGVGSLLAVQIDSNVGTQCRKVINGKYPFVASSQEVDIDDFNRMFSAGGILDDFFQKTLASHVDTSVRPWRYKPVSNGMPPMQGPSLEPFERAATIRQAFFRKLGANQMSWSMGIKVVSLDPKITDLLIDIDGQNSRYVHGPVVEIPVTWPGPRGGVIASLTANPSIRPDTSINVVEGPWALLHLIDRGRVPSKSSSSYAMDYSFDNRHAVLELTAGGLSGRQLTSLLRGFHCPSGGSLARR